MVVRRGCSAPVPREDVIAGAIPQAGKSGGLPPGDKQELPAPHGEDGGLARALPVGAGGEGTGGRAVGGPAASADVRAHLTLNVGLAAHVLLILQFRVILSRVGKTVVGSVVIP